MNELSRVSEYVIERFRTNPLVYTISFEKTSEMDYNKENIYPLVNIDILNSIINEFEIIISYKISILNDRNVDSKIISDKHFGTNFIDNLNECHTIANKFINELKLSNNYLDIEVISLSNIEFIKLYNGQLDGLNFSISLSIDNKIDGCL